MKKILAIDDLQDNLVILKSILNDLMPDVKVITALTGMEGIEAAEAESPDVILLDIIMPGMNGFEVCQQLKSNENCRHIPIIMITAINKDAASKVKGLELGADAFLSKPIDETELVAQVKVMLRIKKAENELRRQRDELQETIQETQNELHLTQERIRLLLDETDEGFWSWDIETGELLFNDNWIRILGYEPGEKTFDNEWWQSTIHPNSKPVFNNALNDYLVGREKYYELEYQVRHKAGHWMWVWTRGICVDYDDQGQPLKMLGTHREITKRKQAEEALKESDERFRTLVTNVEEIVYLIAKDGTFILSEGRGLQKLDLKPGQLVGQSVFELYKEYPEMLEAIRKTFNGDTISKIVHVSGYYFRNWYTPYKNPKGETVGLMGLSVDITEQKLAEDQIKAALKEKETLIDEIHHRVKNNMNVISSLLSLQANSIEDDRTKDILNESRSRVYAMSAIHETLHGSENLSKINLQAYLSQITTSIFQTYSINRDKVKLNIHMEDIPITLNQAYPLGLTINELLSNSLKYAFPENRKGQIDVNMKKQDGDLELIVMDDGIGMPAELDWKNAGTLGLKLITTLVQNQLDGSIEMECINGTKFIIKFSLET